MSARNVLVILVGEFESSQVRYVHRLNLYKLDLNCLSLVAGTSLRPRSEWESCDPEMHRSSESRREGSSGGGWPNF